MKKLFKVICVVCLIILIIILLLPLPKFNDPCCSVVFSKEGKLLCATIAEDEQWRFSEEKEIPKKFESCLLSFEDKYFYYHPGINPVALVRAITLNLKHGEVKSGASTITMQCIRMGLHHPKRSYLEKCYEVLLAIKLECMYSKKKILRLYSSEAPFGNNVVGLSAASWRYYNKSPKQLTWAECATLAVLPNAPSLIYPGKRTEHLLKKRNRLLEIMFQERKMTKEEYEQALLEKIPGKPLPLPVGNETIMSFAVEQGYKKTTLTSSIDFHLQNKMNALVKQYVHTLPDKQLTAAYIIADAESGSLLAYNGNIRSDGIGFVDCARAHRSSGSVLKPILFAEAIEKGIITPTTLLPDYPISYGNYCPNNYNKSFSGAIPAREALAKSMNVPMISLLEGTGIQNFKTVLHQCGFSEVNPAKRDYGLPLIIGGADVSLYEVVSAYTAMSSYLLKTEARKLNMNGIEKKGKLPFHKASVYESFQALTAMKRPDENGSWQMFENQKPIAWKTGTSFGNRDAWTIGVSTNYVVGVWLGHEDATPDPGLIGIKLAAPLMFQMMNGMSGSTTWFRKPIEEYENMNLCTFSGRPCNENCNHTITVALPKTCEHVLPCMYHQSIMVNEDSTLRVSATCYDILRCRKMSVIILPPLMDKYLNTLTYTSLPPWKPDCHPNEITWQIQYPMDHAILILNAQHELPVEIAGGKGHTLYWHLDDQFVQRSEDETSFMLHPDEGEHVLTIMDENGLMMKRTFVVR